MVTYSISIADTSQFLATLLCGILIYFSNPTKSPVRSLLFMLLISGLTAYLFLFGSHNMQVIAGGFLLSSFVSFFPNMIFQRRATGQPVTVIHVLSLFVALAGFVVLFYKAGYFQDYMTLTINSIVALALILCMVIWGFISIFRAEPLSLPAQSGQYQRYHVVEETTTYRGQVKRR